jgi:hypothetical protein
LTGLTADEAEALAVILSRPAPELQALGMAGAGARARDKLLESLPDPVRNAAEAAGRRFRFEPPATDGRDPAVEALADAVRRGLSVLVTPAGGEPRRMHPSALVCGPDGWRLLDARPGCAPICVAGLEAIQISSRPFD